MVISSKAYAPVPTQYTNDQGNLYIGDGTTPNNGFYTVDESYNIGGPGHGPGPGPQPTNDLTLGLSVAYRTNPDMIHADSTSFRSGVLTNHYTVNDGTQSTENGSGSDNANRASANWDYLVGSNNDSLVKFLTTEKGSVTLTVTETSDVTHKANFSLTLHLVTANTSTGVAWADSHNNLFITDDHGSLHATTNSENDLFFGHDTGARTETISLTARAPGVQLIGVTDTIHYVNLHTA